MKFKARHEQKNLGIEGGVGYVEPTDRTKRMSIYVWGHGMTEEATAQMANDIKEFLNDERTSWDYLKMAFSKLLQEINERRNLWKQ